MEYDVVIIGAGIMGTSAAYHISKKNKKVLLVDQYPIKNELNSSQDYSRAFRYEYGNDELYVNLAVESLKRWNMLEEESGKQIYFQCGSLLLGEKEDDYARISYETLKKLGHKVDMMDNNELKTRFPQFTSKFAVLDYHGGILEASTAVDIFADLAKRNGTQILERAIVENIGKNEIIINGERLKFKKLVITCGVWINHLLDHQLSIKVAKQQLVYFTPKDRDLFKKDKLPMFAYLDQGFYGFPIHGIDAVKVSNHTPGEFVDPFTVDRTVDPEFIKECRIFFKRFIPQLADAEVVKTKVCMYDMTPDEDFIVDRISDDVIVSTGFSGHGFKFAPLIGDMLSCLTVDDSYQQKIKRFKLKNF